MNSDRPNVLLGDATYDGTLAAVRNLGGQEGRFLEAVSFNNADVGCSGISFTVGQEKGSLSAEKRGLASCRGVITSECLRN